MVDFLDTENSIVIRSERLLETDQDLSALESDVEEQLIVQDLLYCLMGANGSYVCPGSSGRYEIMCRMRAASKGFVELVLPICNDVAVVKSFCDARLAFSNGQVIHAMCAAIRTVMAEYIQMVAKMESYRRLTLALLLSNLQMPSQLIRVLALLVTDVGSKKGCPALSVVYTCMSEFKGSVEIRKMLQYVFQTSAAPLLSFVEKWIYNGVIDDPFDEFFIRINEAVSPETLGTDYETQFWDNRFDLVRERLPQSSFLPKSAIDKIMFAGKSIAVLTICGLKMRKMAKLTLQALQRETVLDSARLNSSGRLVSALRSEYNLMKYLKMFHSVFLIGRGDWFHRFVDQASQLMKQPRGRIRLPALDTIVALSLPSGMSDVFYAVFEDELLIDTIRRIHDPIAPAKKHAQPFTSSWDYVNLCARVEWPLSLVFTDVIQRKYQLLFRTLIVWRRLEVKLGRCWREPTGIRQFDRIRYAMQLFVAGYLNFTSALVAHPQWDKCVNAIQETSSIEKVFQHHEEALDITLRGFFLTDAKSFELLTAIAHSISQFIEELKKWRITVSAAGTTMTAKIRHGKPMTMFFNIFEKKTSSNGSTSTMHISDPLIEYMAKIITTALNVQYSMSSYRGRSYIDSAVPHRNPRQREIWEQQSVHQSRLNWLHFQARLDGRPHDAPAREVVEQVNPEEQKRMSEEMELAKVLAEEQRLLSEAKHGVRAEVDRCKKMLEEFRRQRQRKVTEKRDENTARMRMYEKELVSLRTALMNEKAEINVSIRHVDVDENGGSADVSELNESCNLRQGLMKDTQRAFSGRSTDAGSRKKRWENRAGVHDDDC